MNIKNGQGWFVFLLSRLGTWILIFTNLVPISLLVTMEMIKYIQGMFISWDIHIYDLEKKAPAGVQTSTLNEELGQVKVCINLTLVYIL
jgi:phospholipid-transporting ATPase